MPPTFVRPDLGSFCRLDELGLQVVGQRLEPGMRAGCHGSPRGSPPAVTRWISWYSLDSAADVSSTDSTQDYCLDVGHQPTDLVLMELVERYDLKLWIGFGDGSAAYLPG